MKIYIFGNNLYQLLNNKNNFYYEWVLENPSERDIQQHELTLLFEYDKCQIYTHENHIFYVVKNIGDFLLIQTNNISASAYEVKDLSLEHLINEKKIICNDDYLYNERLKIIHDFGKNILDYLEIFSLVSNKSNNLSLMDEYKISDTIKSLKKNKSDSKLLNLYLVKTFQKKDIKSLLGLLFDHGVLSQYLDIHNNLLKSIEIDQLDDFVEKQKIKSFFAYFLCMLVSISDYELTKMGNKLGLSKDIIDLSKKLTKYYAVINESDKINSVEQYNKIASLRLDENEDFLKQVNRFSLLVHKRDLSNKTKNIQKKWANFLSNDLEFKSKKDLYQTFLES